MDIPVTVLLPCLNPDNRLTLLVRELFELGIGDFIIVDDGSDSEHSSPFEALKELPYCTILNHPKNRGKGAALKTGFSHFLLSNTKNIGVVTADGDSQHKAKDIIACANQLLQAPDLLILGVRDFTQANIPPRSRYGNRLTSFIFKLTCGISVSDTQTGLRGIGRKNLPPLLLLSGERFEYETNMLLEAKRRAIPIKEVCIQTVYEGDNSGSHFNPFVDSLRIYRLIFAFSLSSAVGWVVDISLFALFNLLFTAMPPEWRLLFSTLLARIGSSAANFLLNRNAVFSSRGDAKASFFRYYGVCIIQTLISWCCVWLLSMIFVGAEIAVKIAVDLLLFFISFRIQRDWVFKQ